jgi:hypothetical protein
MERDLAASDPELVALYGMFTALEHNEQMPGEHEQPADTAPPPGGHPQVADPPGRGCLWWTSWPSWYAL